MPLFCNQYKAQEAASTAILTVLRCCFNKLTGKDEFVEQAKAKTLID